MEQIITDLSGPTVEEYRMLRRLSGLSPKSEEVARRALDGSLFSVCLRSETRAIAMGRVIGDGGAWFEIVDVAVLPEHQRKGLGSRVMEQLMDFLEKTALPSAHITLLADVPADRLYGKWGFRHTAPKTVGMILQITDEAAKA